MISNLFAYIWDRLLHQLSTWRICAKDSACDAYHKDENEFSEGEDERSRQVDEHTSLERNGPSYDSTYQNAAETTSDHQDEGLVDVQLCNKILCASYCPHD
jgi:hypothetical protein